jgi:hypothetical protein
VSEYFDGEQLVSPLTGKPDTLRYPSYSTDDLGFLSPAEQAIVRNAPSGYTTAQIAQLARDIFATHETGPDALNAIIAAVEADRAAENTTPDPQISFREIPPGF